MDQGSAVRHLSHATRRQEVRSTIAACIWAGVATISVAGAALTAASDRGQARIAALFEDRKPTFAQQIVDRTEGDDIAKLSAQLVKLRSEMRLLTLEKEALASKVTRIETSFDPIATATLPGARGNPPTSEALPRQVYPAMPAPDRSKGVDISMMATGSLAEQPRKEVDDEAATSAIARLAAAEARQNESPTMTTRFALEIGSGSDVEELHALWEVMSDQHNELLAGLEPKFGLLSDEDGQHRLLLRAGPIANAADAISACAALRRRGAACSPVSDIGQRLAME